MYVKKRWTPCKEFQFYISKFVITVTFCKLCSFLAIYGLTLSFLILSWHPKTAYVINLCMCFLHNSSVKVFVSNTPSQVCLIKLWLSYVCNNQMCTSTMPIIKIKWFVSGVKSQYNDLTRTFNTVVNNIARAQYNPLLSRLFPCQTQF